MATFSASADAMLKRMSDALEKESSAATRAAVPEDERDQSKSAIMQRLALVDLIEPDAFADLVEGVSAEEVIDMTRSASKAGFAGMRTLARRARFDVLSTLGGWEQAQAVLKSIPREQRAPTLVQIHFEQLLAEEGRRGDIETLGYGNLGLGGLYALREANERVMALGAHVLAREEIVEAINAARTIAPFEHLLTEVFVGREDELEELRNFLGMHPGQPALWKNATSERLLVVEGGGGSGKTALLGHFLLRSREERQETGFPFAYIACDDPTMDVQRPETILGEVARQLIQQFRLRAKRLGMSAELDEAEAEYREFDSRLRNQTQATEDLGSSVSEISSVSKRFSGRRRSLRSMGDALADFSRCVATRWHAASGLDDGPAPLLLIIDTFEQLQYRAQSALSPLWQVIEHWFEGDPAGRLFLSGRPPVSIPAELDKFLLRRELGDLSRSAGAELLELETGLGKDEVENVIEQVGTNPLDLRLTARILRERTAGDSGMPGEPALAIDMPEVGRELVRGRLYRRLVDHIHPDIRALANPGMILRRISPTLIEKVLAPALKIEGVDEAEAHRLYDLLSAEQTLVTLDTDTLVYRPDVRRPVLRLLEESSPSLVRDVQRGAIEVLREDDRPEWRAEAVYHLIMLGAQDEAMDLWSPELGRYLTGAVDDLPIAGKLWLAERIDVSLAPEIYAMADAESWVRIIGPQIIEQMDAGQMGEARKLIERCPEELPPGTALPVIEARLELAEEDYQRAASVTSRALENYPIGGNPGRRAELCWLDFLARDFLGETEKADDRLGQLLTYAQDLDPAVPEIQTLTVMCGRERYAALDATRQAAIQTALHRAIFRATQGEIYRNYDVLIHGFAALNLEWIPRTRPQLALITSSAYDLLSRSRLEVRKGDWRLLTEHARDAREPRALSDAILEAVEDNKLTSSEIISLFSVADKFFGGGGSLEGPVTLTDHAIWVMFRMIPGDFSAATLAGLDPYREEWELRNERTVFKS